MPHHDLLTLDDFVEKYFPGRRRKIADGWAVTCPSCRQEDAFHVLDLYGTAAVRCLTLDCPGVDDGKALGLTAAQWGTALDTVVTDSAKVRTTDSAGKDGGRRKDSGSSRDRDRLTADDVVTWIEANYRLGRSTDGLLFAVPTYPGALRIAREVRSIRSDVLRRYREDQRAKTGRGVVIGKETLSAALDLVSALAEHAQEHPEPVAIRAAQVGDDRVVLDLGDPTGRVVEVTAAGWSVVEPDESTPLFRRSAATQPLPTPERGGSTDTLRELLGLAEDDRRWLLVRGWLAASLFAEVPRPLLWATGSQGSGKSVRTRMVLSLIEPTDSLGKEPGRNERDDSTAARARFLVSYDNITTVSQNTSDWLCRLVTGVTDDRRALYTDDDLRPISYRRSGVATSITLPPGFGSDALERIALVPLDRIPDDQRRGESGLWAAYLAERPKLLGAVLDDVVRVLRHLEDVKREARQRPRMADYADILTALDRSLGLAEDAGHLAAYIGTVDESLADRALDDPFTAAVLTLVEEHRGHWRGTAEQLRHLLDKAAGHDFDRPRWWPTSPRAVSAQLKRASEALRHAGVLVDSGKSNGARYIELTGTVARPTVPADRDGCVPTVPADAAGRRGDRDGGTHRDGLPGSYRPSGLCSPDERKERDGRRTLTDCSPGRPSLPSLPSLSPSTGRTRTTSSRPDRPTTRTPPPAGPPLPWSGR
jgi:hypothetical protein